MITFFIMSFQIVFTAAPFLNRPDKLPLEPYAVVLRDSHTVVSIISPAWLIGLLETKWPARLRKMRREMIIHCNLPDKKATFYFQGALFTSTFINHNTLVR